MATKKRSGKNKATPRKEKAKDKDQAKQKLKTPRKKAMANRKSAKSGKSSTEKPSPKKPESIVKKRPATSKKASASRNTLIKSPKERKKTAKMISRNFLVDLATAIKEAVAPEMSNMKGREIVGFAQSGDQT